VNIDAFFNQHGLKSNPFCAEEARQDRVFDSVERECRHPDFEKILGDLDRPSSSVVFGERGSGKTALRIQIEDSIRTSNEGREDHRAVVVAYDEFNDVLSRLCDHTGMLDPADAVATITLSDQLDAVLGLVVEPLIDAALSGKPATAGPFEGTPGIRKSLRAAPEAVKQDLQRLQTCYDRAEGGRRRADRLRRSLQLGARIHPGFFQWLALICLVLAAGWSLAVALGSVRESWMNWVPTILLILGVLVSAFWWLRLRMTIGRLAKRLATSIRVSSRDQAAFREVVAALPKERFHDGGWPGPGADEARFQLLSRLARVLGVIGYEGLFVLVDRVDEPVAINGDPDRMRAFMWPLFRNKVLQMDGVAFKFLLPLELRDALYRESPEFFREARLDKQNLIERLAWSGPMLYDLCTARMRACAKSDDANLMDFFDDSVNRQDVVDALGQMHQPRDAFKLLYGLIQEHCSNVTTEQSAFSISRTVLDLVRKREVERRESLIRGARPG
jgi:hypothetical protein